MADFDDFFKEEISNMDRPSLERILEFIDRDNIKRVITHQIRNQFY